MFYKNIRRQEQLDGSLGPPTNRWNLLVEVWQMLKELLEKQEKELTLN